MQENSGSIRNANLCQYITIHINFVCVLLVLGKNTNMKYYVKLSFIAKTKLAMEKVGLSYN